MDAHTLDCLEFAKVRDIVARYALSSLGKGLAATMRPIARAELIRRWLTQVVELEKVHDQHGLPPFGGISDVRALIKACAPPLNVNAEQIAQIGDALAGTHLVSQWLQPLPADCTELRHLTERIGDFGTLAERIRGIIDERGIVRDDASPRLRSIRRAMDDCQHDIGAVCDKLLDDPGIRRLLQYPNHTFHGDRMVLPVRTEYRGRVPGIVHRSSDSGATLYVEPAAAVELNNRLTNLRADETEEIARILWDLAHEIYLNESEILRTLDALAVLDLVVAKFRMARQFNLFCPHISDEGKLSVRDARHPLLLELQLHRRQAGELTEPIVPISYRLGEDFDMLLITGPNTGGKTVALKTVGLLNAMVQSGLPVPASPQSSFCIFGEILIDIGDEQSMQQSLSTFSAHLTRQLDMLRHCGQRTLILIDELGAGTDPDEGAAIGKAILDEILHLHGRAMVTTHLGALKSFALSRPRVENASVEFDVQTLRPTYHLRIGEAGQSCAIDIAQRLGMSKRLVFAARRNLSRKARALQAALAGSAEHKRQAETARAAADQARLEAQQALDEAARARAEHEQKKSDFESWLQRVIHLQAGDPVRIRGFEREGRIIRVRLDQQRAEVNVGTFSIEVPLTEILPPDVPAPPSAPPRPQRQKPARPANLRHPDDGNAPRDRRTGNAGGRQHGGNQDHVEGSYRPSGVDLTDEQVAALKPGDRVFAKRFHREGTLVRVHGGKRVATVTIGVLEVEVPFAGLGLAQKKEDRRLQNPRRTDQAQRRAPDNAAGPPRDDGAAPDAQSRNETTEPTGDAPDGS